MGCTMVKVQCPVCKGEGKVPAGMMSEKPEDWIPCPECLGRHDILVKKSDRVKKTRIHR